MAEGTIKRLTDKGFGFIATGSDQDMFFHSSNVEGVSYAINDFDLVFAYPWPNDVELTHQVFDRCAARGALLLAYYDDDAIALYRKD